MEQEIKQKENKILDFFITTLNGMAFGLFATLIVGTIIGSIGSLFTSFAPEISKVLKDTSTLLSCLTGAGIGIGVALSLKMDTLKTIVIASIGEISSYFSLTTKFVSDGTIINTFKIGDPLTIYIVVIISCLLIKLIFQKENTCRYFTYSFMRNNNWINFFYFNKISNYLCNIWYSIYS